MAKRHRWMRLIEICGDDFVRNPHISLLLCNGLIFSADVDSENGMISDSAGGKFHTPQQWYNHHRLKLDPKNCTKSMCNKYNF